ncbi:MAG: tetratricopeptide repeat protein [Caulobacterales bacterium]
MEDLDGIYQRAFEAYRAGQPAAAEAALEALLARSPLDARALLLKSVVHPKTEATVCLALVEHSLHLDPGNPEAWYNLAVFEAERGRLEAALEGYRRAIMLDPLHPHALANACGLLRRLGRPDEAQALAARHRPPGAT